ncbi:oxidoreductase [Cryobacterium roopkundense]|uniref:Fic family protein n=1 Tax=Cryobacterium roopkundense TaxID=1001240 RepID=A0A099J3I3_9MICO|nr:Fic family protein [Cryobacterium roopkundense]KGJ72067.1 oxidoreductase [Cryobacterium roopkundense]MBB5643539.1 Fic family protein [Cryobacterium roopkundense]
MHADITNTAWPPHQVETLPWRQQIRSGTREDRELSSVDATIPPLIRTLDYMPPLAVLLETEKALLAVAQADTDAQAGTDAEGHSAALSRFMVRSESVASSKIEHISASALDYAQAVAGNRGNASAMSIVAASAALHELITTVEQHGRFELEHIISAHRALMLDDPSEASYAGRLRDMQNWIGGSDYSPRDALHVPPAPERVAELMTDLVAYLNRDDVPVMVQAAIGHAQFESIHAFTDGNGRIGRAMVSAVLRRRGVTRNAVVPLASGLLARREDYFASLGAYRRGDPAPVVSLFARSARAAAECSRGTIARLKALPDVWAAELRPRAGSAAAALIQAFYDHPVMSAAEIEARSGSAASQAYRAIDQLTRAGYIQEITGRKKNRVWAASEALAELDDLDRRIQAAMA